MRLTPEPITGFDACLDDQKQALIYSNKDQKTDLLGEHLDFPMKTDPFPKYGGKDQTTCSYYQFQSGIVGEFNCTDKSEVSEHRSLVSFFLTFSILQEADS